LSQKAQTPSLLLSLLTLLVLCIMQEWNEIQFNGVYYNPSKKGKPGELPAADTSYTFRYPRPDRYAPNHSKDSCCLWCCVTGAWNTEICTMHYLIAGSKIGSHQATCPACTHKPGSSYLWKLNINTKSNTSVLLFPNKTSFSLHSVVS